MSGDNLQNLNNLAMLVKRLFIALLFLNFIYFYIYIFSNFIFAFLSVNFWQFTLILLTC